MPRPVAHTAEVMDAPATNAIVHPTRITSKGPESNPWRLVPYHGREDAACPANPRPISSHQLCLAYGIQVPGASHHSWDAHAPGAKHWANGTPSPGVACRPDSALTVEVEHYAPSIHVAEARHQTHPSAETLPHTLPENNPLHDHRSPWKPHEPSLQHRRPQN